MVGRRRSIVARAVREDEMSVLLREREDGIVTLTLNRPEKMNALSAELRAALVAAFDELGGDVAVRVVILTGAGRAFCAGLDLKELGGGEPGGAIGAARELDVVGALRRFDRPIIGAINGVAVTGGFELALACDVLVASSEARFADTHVRVGILPGWGLSQKLPRLIGISRAKELSLTGNYLSAADAVAWGLVNRVVPADGLLPACRALARDMASCDPAMVRAVKRVIDEGYATTLADGLALEARASREHARGVKPEEVEARRRAVQQRGRAQTGGGS
jgi:enoyl-CoA hydratase